MCRHVAYIGPPIPLGDIVTTPAHSLAHQAHAARELLRGSVCADGFGVGWYAPAEGESAKPYPRSAGAPADIGADPEPAVYRRECPIWADPDLAGVGRAVRSGVIVASVRNATPEVGHVGSAAVQPLPFGRHLFAHNGFIDGFSARARELRALLPDDLYSTIRGGGDSETLFLLILSAVRDAGGDLAAGTGAVLSDLVDRAPRSALNVAVTDGRTLVASRMAGVSPADSLYMRRISGGGTLVASEALDDDPGWIPVPEGSLVVCGDTRATPKLQEVAR